MKSKHLYSLMTMFGTTYWAALLVSFCGLIFSDASCKRIRNGLFQEARGGAFPASHSHAHPSPRLRRLRHRASPSPPFAPARLLRLRWAAGSRQPTARVPSLPSASAPPQREHPSPKVAGCSLQASAVTKEKGECCQTVDFCRLLLIQKAYFLQ